MVHPFAEVIGDPIAHSKSPVIHRFWLEKLGLAGDYQATRVAADELGAFIAGRRANPQWRGCNVTVPHKQAVMQFVDRLNPLAAEVGAVNSIYREQGDLVGGNSDVAGIVTALPHSDPGYLRQACLIGSGGAALAALAAFRMLGVVTVGLNVRNREKGEAMLAASGLAGRVAGIDDRANVQESQLIVNATTLGMVGQSAMPESLLAHVRNVADRRTIVFDMVYAPLETSLLKAAAERGLRTVDGLAMLVGQAATAFEAFFGTAAPREFDTELRAVLTS